ncbi:MAG: amidohydrolase [Firmicutes bacterium]|nr:amidohydrolase [Bacillota bacterium]
MRTLLKNCVIVARKSTEPGDGAGYDIIKNGFLGIDGKYIDCVSAEKPAQPYDTEKDMDGAIVLPALVNAHGHASMTLLRGAGTGLPLQRWLNEAIFPVEAKLTPDDIRVGTNTAMLEMLASGTVLFSEMYDFPYADAEAVAAAGMKTNISRVGLCFSPDFDEKTDVRFNEASEFVSVMRGDTPENAEAAREVGTLSRTLRDAVADGRIVPEFCLHSEYLTTEPYVRAVAHRAKELGVPVNIHVSETKKEHEECLQRHGLTPIAYLKECLVFGSPTYAAHCVWVTDEDLKIMKECGVSLVHNPSSNMKLGSGIAPVVKALSTGVNVALGTDGTASNNNLNMFEELHLAALLAAGSACDPAAISTAQLMDMATLNGAKAMGRTDTGVLAPGMKADICAVSAAAPHMHPNADTLGLLCYSAQASDVCMTMADGKILYENGIYTTLDKEKILSELEKTVDDIAAR